MDWFCHNFNYHYCLMKQYETRLVLFVSGVIMAIISGNLMVAFDAFSKSMKMQI